MATQPQGNYIFITNPPVGREQVEMTCPHCHSSITTEIEYKNSAKTHVLCILYSMACCCLYAPFVYYNEDNKAVEHFCPNCHKFLGRYDG